MRRWVVACTAVISVLLALACTPEDEIITREPGISLSFSQDTVFFDTLFTSRQSITRNLKVYNPGERAVETTIRLAGGDNSAYDIFVNGQVGVSFENVRLRGGDSLLILVEALIDPQDENMPFLVEDSLLFLTNENQQTVQLRSWGQDANYIMSWQIYNDTSLSADRPYVIMDSIRVWEQGSLLIPAGAELYFEQGANLWIDGRLKVEGNPEQPVLFTHSRLDGSYANAAGQWQGILFGEQSEGNDIRYAKIRNAEVGIFMSHADEDTIPDLLISNTIIENMSVNGILAANADIDAYNLLVSHCIVNTVGNFGRGYYRYTHCTFANDVVSFSREGPTLFFADTLLAEPQISQPFELVLQNSIVWGNRDNELRIITELPDSHLQIRHNLLKSDEIDLPEADGNILNEDPQFTDPAIYVYTLDSTSAAVDQGVPTFVDQDLAGNDRDSQPDLGAYEYIKTEEE